MAFLSKNAIFRPNIELEAIARQSVEASREVICAYFGNIDRNSGYFLLRIFLSSHPNGDPWRTKIGKWAEIVILCMSITNCYEFDRPRTISIV